MGLVDVLKTSRINLHARSVMVVVVLGDERGVDGQTLVQLLKMRRLLLLVRKDRARQDRNVRALVRLAIRCVAIWLLVRELGAGRRRSHGRKLGEGTIFWRALAATHLRED